MLKKFLVQTLFYSAALLTAVYLADGQSIRWHVVFVSVSILATFMSQRESVAGQRQPVLQSIENASPLEDALPFSDHEITRAHVEELLSHAS